jgi:hypothetical protein
VERLTRRTTRRCHSASAGRGPLRGRLVGPRRRLHTRLVDQAAGLRPLAVPVRGAASSPSVVIPGDVQDDVRGAGCAVGDEDRTAPVR